MPARTNGRACRAARPSRSISGTCSWSPGVDDVLNQRRANAGGGAFFDWFFGMQLLFRDEDLKSMLLFGGSAVGGAAR